MGERVDVTVTFLRQTARPFLPPQPRPPGKLALLRVGDPPLHFYRYMYDLVGRPWNWVSRRGLSDDALCALIKNPAVHLYVLYVDGAPAGMAEIDASKTPCVDIRFFGLAPDFIGRGLSRFFLANVIDLAWDQGASELQIETCTLDHPAALALYQKFGFTVFDQRQGSVELLGDRMEAQS